MTVFSTDGKWSFGKFKCLLHSAVAASHVTEEQVAQGHLTVVYDAARFSTFTADKHKLIKPNTY